MMVLSIIIQQALKGPIHLMIMTIPPIAAPPFSCGDPDGILTAPMLMFAFFVLAFEQIRRRK